MKPLVPPLGPGLCDDGPVEGGRTYFSFSLISQAGVKPSAPIKTDLSAAPPMTSSAPAKTDTAQGSMKEKGPVCFGGVGGVIELLAVNH